MCAHKHFLKMTLFDSYLYEIVYLLGCHRCAHEEVKTIRDPFVEDLLDPIIAID